MTKNKRFCLTIVLIVAVCCGCKKFLETPPDSRAVIDSPEKVSELLTSAYPRENYIPFTELMSDNAGDKGAAAGSTTSPYRDPWMFNDVQSRDSDSPEAYWYGCYKAIAAANRALKVIDGAADGKDYTAQKGEALLCRAYAHFMLVTLFSRVYNPATAAADPGIPYVTEPEEQLSKQYERKTVADVYRHIAQDLTAGLPLLNDGRYTAPKFHFTRAAAHAFAARFYLFFRDYQQVVDHARAVFPSADLSGSLRPVNSAAYRALEYSSKMADYTLSTNRANLLLAEASTAWGRTYAVNRYGLTGALLSELFYNTPLSGGQYAYPVYGSTDLLFNVPKFFEHFVKSDLNANYGQPYNMIPLLSAEELLMNRAEALAMLGQPDAAIADLNTFASKKVFLSEAEPYYDPLMQMITAEKLNEFYGLPSIQQNIVQAVLDFKRREFIHEGLRYFDILRHHLEVQHISYDRSQNFLLMADDPRKLFQLPREVVSAGVPLNPR